MRSPSTRIYSYFLNHHMQYFPCNHEFAEMNLKKSDSPKSQRLPVKSTSAPYGRVGKTVLFTELFIIHLQKTFLKHCVQILQLPI